MRPAYRFPAWFACNWSRTGLPLAVGFLLLSPLLFRALGLATWLAFLLLPVYMIHQYEEHAHGAFKAEIVRMLPGVAPTIDRVILVVNILGVWVVYTLVVYLAYYLHGAIGLVAAYIAVANGLLHIGIALKQRRYNPGLGTGVSLFLPVGGYAIVAISRSAHATIGDQALGIGAAILLHALTFLAIGLAARGNR
ncbi:MAG: HXXEE domain-containing protein [Chloroflexota bacterium]|nr:HXXEE domain-containing protein [Chloroflexota bacterium]